MLHIVIPMAGRGSRFSQAGYQLPKPLIPVGGVPMIKLVVGNVRPVRPHRFIFVCQAAHVAAHGLDVLLEDCAPGCTLVELDGVTEGAACSVLAAAHLIDTADPLLVANSDQYVEGGVEPLLAALDEPAAGGAPLDGVIMTMRASDPKWSYAAVGRDGLVSRVAEKQPISPHATAGIYAWRHGRVFVRGARSMIARGLRVDGEYYVAPVYNENIAEGARIAIHDVGPEGEAMHGLGVPDDLQRFVRRRSTTRFALCS